jgi:uncharacterized protein (TIGR02266 family)
MDAEDPTISGAARRRAPRASVVLQLAYRSASHLLVSYCTNLSRGGLFVPSKDPLPPGSHLSLSLTIPGDPEPIELHAEVRWVRSFDALEGPAGMGLAFEDIDEVLGDRVDAIVAEFVPLRVALVGDHAATLGHVASIVRTLVSCATDEQPVSEAHAEEVSASDLIVIEIGADAEPAMALLRQLASRPHAPPRIALCDARSEIRARCISLCRIVGTPIEPGELREAVLDSVAQVDARRHGP